jgi:hypothetical protein
MKNQYFGDVNDYAKYGLLRVFSPYLRVGVVWMMTPDDSSNDGRKMGYLERDALRHHDAELFAWLTQWYRAGASRDVQLVEKSGLLANCSFFRDIVPDGTVDRAAWFDRARQFVGDCDLAFFDPDNGLAIKSVRPGQRGWSKYLSLEEVKGFYDAGKSVLVYQHFGREHRDTLIAAKLSELSRVLRTDRLKAFSASNWVAILVEHPDHLERLGNACARVSVDWNGFMETDFSRREIERRPVPAHSEGAQRPSGRGTTEIGYINPRKQTVLEKTDRAGSDHRQRIYILRCEMCGAQYGANGSDIFQRRCPSCQNGAPGL